MVHAQYDSEHVVINDCHETGHFSREFTSRINGAN